MPTTETPLRYPGGKTQLAPFVVDLLRANRLLGGVYAEPFAGGAGLACRLLLAGHVSEIWLNDIDPNVHAFWDAVLNQTEGLCELIDSTPVTIEEWNRQKGVVERGRAGTLKLGFATLFLNRTNRSGIINGGVIGGKDQKGNYKIDCRFNRDALIEKIRRIATYREVIALTRTDALRCISEWSKRMPRRGLMNIDPPYFSKGQDLYTNFYTGSDHEDLSTAIRSLRCHWMLTYDDVDDIERLYRGLPMYRKGLIYYAQVKRRASELIVLAPSLAAPESLYQQAA